MDKNTKKPRVYRRITPADKAAFKAAELLTGNGSAAIRLLEPTRISPKDRAFHITKKRDDISVEVFIDDQLQQIGVDAVNRVGKMINSSDERVATKNAHFVIDHIRGQATKKSIAVTAKINIESVLA